MKIKFARVGSGVILASISLTSMALPTEEEIKGVQILCGAGNVQSATLKGNVDAAIKSWRDASAGISVEIAKKNLTGALSQLKDDNYQEPMYKVYVGCVSDTLQKYFDQERKKPKEVSSSGSSSVLLRSAFASNDAIMQVGCEEAKNAAVDQLASMCTNGSLSITKVRCPQVSGSPRTYSASVQATCTPN